MAHQVIMLQSKFVGIPNVRMSRWNIFCFIPPSLGAALEFWYIESGPLDRLWSLKKKKKYTVQNGWKKKPLQTRCNVGLGVSIGWGFTSLLNIINNSKEMIKTCILLNIQTRGLNPLTHGSDSHVISPYNIHLLSSKQVMRIFSCIR